MLYSSTTKTEVKTMSIQGAIGYLRSDIEWSIYQDTKDDNSSNWVDDNEVSDHIADGIYEVEQFDFSIKRKITLNTKVLVWKGKIDIESSKEAVSEFLNRADDWHNFIEGVIVGEKPNTITFILGS